MHKKSFEINEVVMMLLFYLYVIFKLFFRYQFNTNLFILFIFIKIIQQYFLKLLLISKCIHMHRDLKLMNFLLNKNNHVHVINFDFD